MRLFQLFLVGFGLFIIQGQIPSQAQIYYVYFKDKPSLEHPENDFHPKALERRARLGIGFPQEDDLPLDSSYTRIVSQMVDSVRFQLRWFNAMTVKGNLKQMEEVSQLTFVTAVVPMEESWGGVTGTEKNGIGVTGTEKTGTWKSGDLEIGAKKKTDTAKVERLVVLQRKMLGLDILKKHDLNGSGVRIAIFDAGFSGVDEHPAFKHLRDNGQIVATKDFYGNDDNVYHHGGHGTAVLSCLAGMFDERNLGAATGADFYLARTEHGMWEKMKEEDCWLAAAQWADQKGVDIISSSLGYGKKRYTYEDLDGKTTLVTRAAQTANNKGILVVNSAGNTGTSKDFHITAPGDGANVLTVGSSYPMLAFPMPYTSRGPNSSGVLKPNVSGPGYVIAADKKGGFDFIGGTSFACPSIAGVAACLKQLHPEYLNFEIINELQEISHLAPFYNYQLGYGIPQVQLLFEDSEKPEPGFEITVRNDTAIVKFDQEIVNRDTAEQRSGKPCFAHWRMENGMLSASQNFLIQKEQGLALPLTDSKGGQLFIWFEGTIWSSEERGFVH